MKNAVDPAWSTQRHIPEDILQILLLFLILSIVLGFIEGNVSETWIGSVIICKRENIHTLLGTDLFYLQSSEKE
jgi:hypothetical protein